MRQSLESHHHELRLFVSQLLSDNPAGEGLSTYFAQRSQYELAIKQDLLPLFVFDALSNQPNSRAKPLVTAWALNLAAAHLVDEAQDQGKLQDVHRSMLALGAANTALAQLEADGDVLRDVLDAIGRVAMLGMKGQQEEWVHGRIWSRSDYFRSIAGKAAAIIATGIWLGGRLATDDAQTLKVLQEFGLALGMAIQIADDCLDLAEDLLAGTYTLPIIEALALRDHPAHPQLARLLAMRPLTAEKVQEVVHLVEEMGAMARCQRVVRAYQVQAAAVFPLFPGLEPYFASYVAAEA